MQVSPINNQTSFGLNSLKFSNKLSEKCFWENVKQIPDEKLAMAFRKIRAMKPKNGPDVDAFITGYGFCVKTAKHEGGIESICKKTKNNDVVITPKSLVKGFKNLIKNIDKERAIKP